jgi:hypothetical protein
MLFVIFYEDGDIFIQFKSYEQFKLVIYDTISCSYLLIIVICKDIAFCLTGDFYLKQHDLPIYKLVDYA